MTFFEFWGWSAVIFFVIYVIAVVVDYQRGADLTYGSAVTWFIVGAIPIVNLIGALLIGGFTIDAIFQRPWKNWVLIAGKKKD